MSQCHAWFRVTAEHLREANGFVTCGECDAVFNALTTLIEETASPDTLQHAPVAQTAAPTITQTSAIETAADPSTTDSKPALKEKPDAAGIGISTEEPTTAPADAPDPELDIAEFEELLAANGEVLEEVIGKPTPGSSDSSRVSAKALEVAPGVEQETDADDGSGSLLALDDEAADALPEASMSADDHAILFTRRGESAEGDDIVPDYLGDDAAPPAVLRSDLDALAGGRARPGLTRFVWNALAVITFAAAAAQITWVYRDWVMAALPAAEPVIENICHAIGCSDGKMRDAESLRLLARDVREHPQYRDALLVNATMVNVAPNAKPFSAIELSLHDAAGKILGAWLFQPSEYLDGSIAIAEGMPPDKPVYIVMELGGDAHAAVSCEFKFL